MSERFTMRVPAGAGNVFAPGALDRQIGGTIDIRHGDGNIEGRVVAAEIAEDGTAALVTVEVPDGTLPRQPLAGYSISADSLVPLRCLTRVRGPGLIALTVRPRRGVLRARA